MPDPQTKQRIKGSWALNDDGGLRLLWGSMVVNWVARVLAVLATLLVAPLARELIRSGELSVQEWTTGIALVFVVLAGLTHQIARDEARSRHTTHTETHADNLTAELKNKNRELGLMRHKHRAEVEKAKTEGAAVLSSGLPTVLAALLQASGDDWRAPSVDAFLRTALLSTTSMVDIPKVRACLFEYEKVERDQRGPEKTLVARLEPANSTNPPRREFRDADDHGRELIEMMLRNESILVPDVTNPPVRVSCENRPYKTFIAAAIVWQGTELGVLTADAPIKGSLTDHHKDIVRLAAQFVAIGLYFKEHGSAQDTEDAVARGLDALWEGPDSLF
ncbi:GAF domain-containing protein [Nesterenkonia haasae]|uniref:hypothetical protein n=1 Tax=Nesterenkonia haasae TaxID=2587813 RepID=UPI001391811E|nr:hypothetical protein [Nesterenkonia haasae]NDK31166.1 hypothetical protein [Nesterenkonia haasae]